MKAEVHHFMHFLVSSPSDYIVRLVFLLISRRVRSVLYLILPRLSIWIELGVLFL